MYLNKKLYPRHANLEKPDELLLLYFQYKNGPQHSDYKHDKLLDYRLSLLGILLRLLPISILILQDYSFLPDSLYKSVNQLLHLGYIADIKPDYLNRKFFKLTSSLFVIFT